MSFISANIGGGTMTKPTNQTTFTPAEVAEHMKLLQASKIKKDIRSAAMLLQLAREYEAASCAYTELREAVNTYQKVQDELMELEQRYIAENQRLAETAQYWEKVAVEQASLTPDKTIRVVEVSHKGLLLENDQLKSDLETERMRLAACGVAANQNTETTAKERIKPDNPYYSASYGDVCRAVDREMDLLDLEHGYCRKLGEMARLSDIVCTHILESYEPVKQEVYNAAEDIMEYVNHVRP
jgi:hypothetical protein